jgi:hypothetical protein
MECKKDVWMNFGDSVFAQEPSRHVKMRPFMLHRHNDISGVRIMNRVISENC